MRTLWRPVQQRPVGLSAPYVEEDVRRVAAFSPLSFANLEEYYNSKGTGVANGAPINPWVDQSGHTPTRDQVNAVPGITTSPTRSAGTSPNGSDEAAFNGTDAETTSGTINPFPPATRGHSFFIGLTGALTSAPPAAFAGALLWSTSLFNSCPRELVYQNVGGNLIQWRDSGGFHGTTPTPTGARALAFLFDPVSGNGTIYVDGAAVFTAAYTFGGNAADTTALSRLNVPSNSKWGYFAWYSNYYPQLVAPFDAFGASGWGY